MSRILVFMLMMSTFALASSGNADMEVQILFKEQLTFYCLLDLSQYLIVQPAKLFCIRSQAIADELKSTKIS